MTNKKRKICFVITSFIHYSRSIFILQELKKRKDIELSIAVGGSALLSKSSSRKSRVEELLHEDGFANIHQVYFNLEGDVAEVKAKTTGLGIIEFANLFGDLKPDLVVVRGDRFEVLAAVVAATYMNISVAHIEGGDVSGTLDESIRHAITKLSHIHFVSNEPAKKRIIGMGENDKYVFNFGSPDIEVAKFLGDKVKGKFDINKTGSGAHIDVAKDFVMVMYHPVTSETKYLSSYTKILLSCIHGLGMQAVWFWPNVDVGAEDISHVLRSFNDQVKNHKIRFLRYMPPKEFMYLLKNTICLVGNSSAGVKESSYLGIPVVNLGSRQNHRMKDQNVLDVEHNEQAITKAIRKQMKIHRYPSSKMYLKENTSKNIASILATAPLYVQKKFHE